MRAGALSNGNGNRWAELAEPGSGFGIGAAAELAELAEPGLSVWVIAASTKGGTDGLPWSTWWGRGALSWASRTGQLMPPEPPPLPCYRKLVICLCI